ncbi:DMT family transporter [Balneatrix alpica]|uniref:DMT family transporter n=1 Tax=Balneatrix alpica TaxID=75684 RepID=A0ABV5ZGG8_9GAMM|nr:DMT family transporter [Balneatrix alpica]
MSKGYGMAVAGLTLTTLFWAVNAIVGRAVVGDIPPLTLAFWRWTTAALILLPLAWSGAKQHWPQIRQQWPWLLLLSILSVTAYNTILYVAVQTTTAINTSLMNTLIPLSTLLMAWVILGSRPLPLQWLGMLLGAAGMLLVISRGDVQVLTQLAFTQGDLWMLLAVGCWALYSVLLRKRSLLLPPLVLLGVMVWLGLPWLALMFLWEWGQGQLMQVHWGSVGVILYTGIFPSVLAYLFWNHGVAMLGPGIASLFIFLMPVFGSVLATWLLGEAFEFYHAIGGAFILLGLVAGVQAQRVTK